MISETLTAMSPERTIDVAKRFFTDSGAMLPATIVNEGENHLTVATFRSRLAISAWLDPDGRGTRVRVSTLRRDDAVGKLLTLLATSETGDEAGSSGPE
jgi:hypothetical protein